MICFCIHIFVFACFSAVPCQKPTLRLFSSCDNKNEQVSFACFAKHFSPKDFKITWLINNKEITNQKVEEKTTPPQPEIKNENGTFYSATSFITITAPRTTTDKIKCRFTTEKADCQQTVEQEMDIRPGRDGGKLLLFPDNWYGN